MPHVRPAEVVESALRASDSGMRDVDNAKLHGVAVKTIRRWRRVYQREGMDRGQAHTSVPCPRCEELPINAPAYAELLGWYLGDGYISQGRRGVYNLHIYNDAQYPRLNAHVAELMRRVKPGGRPHTRGVAGCIVTTVSWKHWPCLFPQLGPGRKHERQIVLAGWQQKIVGEHGFDFLRGLFHSDGCRVSNWATRTVGGRRKRYDYGRWMFVNRSDDILGLCTAALDAAGIRWRRPRINCIAVSRADDVRRLDERIGLKG